MAIPEPDPFGAVGIRERVLAAWAASPARFREDANAEEDAALGAYRDRLVVELVQNACDAATSAGVAARVSLRLHDVDGGTVLDVANTGAPLTAPGLEALSTLRASSKRDEGGSVGRFGVGFAAVLAVSDEPLIVSRDGVGYAWSRSRSHALVASVPALAEELSRRDGHVPTLRLPFAVETVPAVPDGFDTLVRLPLRSAETVVLTRALLDGVDPTLPLLLDGLAELTVGERSLRVLETDTGEVLLDDAGHVSTWRRAEIRGRVPEELLADRPVEERGRSTFVARALLPEDGWPSAVPQVLRAPQPTDEPLSLPVLVSVPLPVDPGRRQTLPGPLRDFLLGQAAAAVAALARSEPASLALVPVGLAAGESDRVLRDAVLSELRERVAAGSWLPGDAVLDLGAASDPAYEVLHEVIDGLLPTSWPVRSPALDAVGIRRLDTAAVVELLTSLGVSGRHPAAWWQRVYTALADAPDRDALGALPVPLADGSCAAGPRGLLVPIGELPADAIDGLPVRLVDAAAAHPLLLRLGAREATPRAVLDALAPAVEDLVPEQILPLVALAGVRAGELPWLRELDLEGDYVPGSPLAAVLDPEAGLEPVPDDVVERWGEATLAACGVIARPVVVNDPDAVLDLDGGADWLDAQTGVPDDAAAVADLELFRWPEALAVLLADRDARDALSARGSYTAWWLAAHPVMNGLFPAEVLAPQADPLLNGVYEPGPEWLDESAARALGCRTELPTEDDDLLDLLDRVGDPERDLDRAQVRLLYAAAAERGVKGEPPLLVRAVSPDGELVCVAPRDAVVVDAPDLLPLVGTRAVVPVPLHVAELLSAALGVPLASELARYDVVSEQPLRVADAAGRPVAVSWRVTSDGVVHSDGPEGLGRARAWLDGRWGQRHAYVAALRDPAAARVLALEDDLAD